LIKNLNENEANLKKLNEFQEKNIENESKKLKEEEIKL